MTEPFPPPRKRQRWRWAVLTLVPLVVVLGLLFPVVPMVHRPPKRVVARNDLTMLQSALKMYYTEYGVLPVVDGRELFATLRGKNPGKIIFFEAAPEKFSPEVVFLDPWGTPYRITVTDPQFPVYSCGKDRVDGGGAEGSDDLASWR